MSAPIHGVLQKDDNGYTVAGGVSSVNPVLVLNAEIDPSTGRLLVNSGGSGASLNVTDGITTVTGVTIIDFTSGATVTGTTGTADVAISGSSHTFIYNEIVSGSTNTFTLSHTPVTGFYAVYANGQRLTPGAGNDFTISGAIITTTNSFAAGAILADYQY